MVQQPAGPSRRATLLDFFAEPIVVVNGGREQVQRELIGPPAGGRREPIQLGFELRRYMQVHEVRVVGQNGLSTSLRCNVVPPASRSQLVV
jgi:hypothetical protein